MEPETINIFSAILNSWTSLKVAISYGCAGKNSSDKLGWLPSGIFQWLLENDGVNCAELEETLKAILFEDFDLLIDDGSVNLICIKLLDSFNLCRCGKFSEAKLKYPDYQVCNLPDVRLDINDDNCDVIESEDDESEEEMITNDKSIQKKSTHDIHQSTSNSQISCLDSEAAMECDDGWTQVKHKKR